jgi:glycosyltransferase involved in cell wall biosynthesis
VVFAVSHHLHRDAQRLNAHAHWLPNATSLHELPGDVGWDAAIERSGRPRLGYIGQIGDRVDFDLLRVIAESQPGWSILMIGPVWSNRVRQAEDLARLPNVHFLGRRPYAALPGIIRQLDVCLIPHTVDALTDSMDPIKLYDYLALGKPIVATHVAGVDRFADAVYVARSPEAFIAQIAAALGETGGALTARRLALGRENSWETRAEQLWTTVKEVADARAARRGAPTGSVETAPIVPKPVRGLLTTALPRRVRPAWWALRARRDRSPLTATLRDALRVEMRSAKTATTRVRR